MDRKNSPNQITRESLVNILEILHSLATPEGLDELLRKIIDVGRAAIVAEAGILWLVDDDEQLLNQVIPHKNNPPTLKLGESWAGLCAQNGDISNIHDCRDDAVFIAHPFELENAETRSLLNVPIIGQADNVIGVMQWLGANVGQFDNHDEWIGPALAAQAAVAIQHSKMTDELLATATLGQEVALAREIQMSTLPSEMPDLNDYDLHGHFQPTDHTGGDLYDIVMINEKLFLLMGDATGHGFGPALSATQMQAMLRVAFRLGADLDSAYMQVNNQLEEDLPDDRFITAFIGFLDPRTHVVTYHSGGQGPLLHYKAAEDLCEWFKPTHFPLGVMPIDEPLQPHTIELQPGDILALISDGVYEYNNSHAEEFGEQRVAEIVQTNSTQPMSELNDAILERLHDFAGDVTQADDITMVLVRRQA
ncbi:MAG: sigma-B regulation protein RsbU (phosphoserine phosphatase) [Pseudoalteromonas tetraodonis]|jgi:sigma-B regulation protein RsbU (phosphoserine phosphatase)